MAAMSDGWKWTIARCMRTPSSRLRLLFLCTALALLPVIVVLRLQLLKPAALLLTSSPVISSSVTSSSGTLPAAKPFYASEDIADASVEETNKSSTVRLPDVLLIGVRKAGTRALLDALKLHPLIRCARREVHFFDDDERFGRGVAWYARQLPTTGSQQILLEKTPAYFTAPAAPARVLAVLPEARFIVILREPVTRAISDFTQVYYNRLELNKTLPVFEELAFKRNGSEPADFYIDSSYKPVRNSLYAEHLARWLRLFPLHRFLFVDGDSFRVQPLPQLRLVEAFLGLPPLIFPDQLIYNHDKGFFCFRKSREARARCLGSSKGRPHRPIHPEIVARLHRLLEPHNRRFFNLTNRVFDW